MNTQTLKHKFTSNYKMKFIIQLFIILTLFNCTKKDCSSIDLSRLSEIKLPVNVKSGAKNLEDFNAEVDLYMPPTYKLIIRCRSENDFQQDRVLPGVMLWLSDSWDLRSDTSKLGKLFLTQKIDPFERTRLAGILYHRHLNEQDLALPTLLKDASIRSKYQGRVHSEVLLKEFSESEQQLLLSKIQKTDSIVTALNTKELAISTSERKKNKLDEVIADRYSTMESINILAGDIQEKKPTDNDIKNLKDSSYHQSFIGFNELKTAQKLILLESIRHQVLAKETKALKIILTSITDRKSKPKVSASTK